MNARKLWKIITAVEIVAAAAAILFDLFLPTLILLGLALVSLLIRREPVAVLGFKQPSFWPKMTGLALLDAVCLQLFDAGVLMPILNRLTGATIDYSGFARLQGNLGQLLLAHGFYNSVGVIVFYFVGPIYGPW